MFTWMMRSDGKEKWKCVLQNGETWSLSELIKVDDALLWTSREGFRKFSGGMCWAAV